MNALQASYPEMLVEGITSLDNLVIAGKMIENIMKNERIEVEETNEGIALKNKKEAQVAFLENQLNRGYTSYPAYPSYPPCYLEINHATPTPYIYQLSGPAYPPIETVNPAFMPQAHQTHIFDIENSDQRPKPKKKRNTDWTQSP